MSHCSRHDSDWECGDSVHLYTKLNDELIEEGKLNDLKRQIQSYRKNIGADILQHVEYRLETDDSILIKALESNREEIEKETKSTIEIKEK